MANDNESQIKFIEMDANGGGFWEMHQIEDGGSEL